MGTPSSVIRLHARDNVAIARSDINGGPHLVELDGLIARSPIPAAHKVAAVDIRRGEPVLRYGQIIGFATSDIEAGDHVHTHNLAMGTFERDYAFGASGAHVRAPRRSMYFRELSVLTGVLLRATTLAS
jgi:altronate hydrolase